MSQQLLHEMPEPLSQEDDESFVGSWCENIFDDSDNESDDEEQEESNNHKIVVQVQHATSNTSPVTVTTHRGLGRVTIKKSWDKGFGMESSLKKGQHGDRPEKRQRSESVQSTSVAFARHPGLPPQQQGEHSIALQERKSVTPINKRGPLTKPTPLLHRFCCRPAVTVTQLRVILQSDPSAIQQAAVVVVHTDPKQLVGMRRQEPFHYPLNLAIHNNASKEVLFFLLQADRTILSRTDGIQKESSLHILLRQSRPDAAVLVQRFLMVAAKQSFPLALQLDARGQVPLHVAISHSSELIVIRQLVQASPQALHVSCRAGLTPVKLASFRHATCSERVAEYLYQFSSLILLRENEFDDSGI
jgi:hypothetical protein